MPADEDTIIYLTVPFVTFFVLLRYYLINIYLAFVNKLHKEGVIILGLKGYTSASV